MHGYAWLLYLGRRAGSPPVTKVDKDIDSAKHPTFALSDRTLPQSHRNNAGGRNATVVITFLTVSSGIPLRVRRSAKVPPVMTINNCAT